MRAPKTERTQGARCLQKFGIVPFEVRPPPGIRGTVVPSDGVASNTNEENDVALNQMRKILKCAIRSAATIDFAALAGGRSA